MSKTNATNVEIEYKVFKPVVICKLTFEVPEVGIFTCYDLKDIISDIGISSKGAMNRITVIGKSKCNPLDTFNETLGKRIAESRAKYKMFNILRKINLIAANKLMRTRRECINKFNNCLEMGSREQVHLNRLLNE